MIQHDLILTSPCPQFTGLRVVGTTQHESTVELNFHPEQYIYEQ